MCVWQRKNVFCARLAWKTTYVMCDWLGKNTYFVCHWLDKTLIMFAFGWRKHELRVPSAAEKQLSCARLTRGKHIFCVCVWLGKNTYCVRLWLEKTLIVCAFGCGKTYFVNAWLKKNTDGVCVWLKENIYIHIYTDKDAVLKITSFFTAWATLH